MVIPVAGRADGEAFRPQDFVQFGLRDFDKFADTGILIIEVAVQRHNALLVLAVDADCPLVGMRLGHVAQVDQLAFVVGNQQVMDFVQTTAIRILDLHDDFVFIAAFTIVRGGNARHGCFKEIGDRVDVQTERGSLRTVDAEQLFRRSGFTGDTDIRHARNAEHDFLGLPRQFITRLHIITANVDFQTRIRAAAHHSVEETKRFIDADFRAWITSSQQLAQIRRDFFTAPFAEFWLHQINGHR